MQVIETVLNYKPLLFNCLDSTKLHFAIEIKLRVFYVRKVHGETTP